MDWGAIIEVLDDHEKKVPGNDLEMLSTLGPGFAMGNCRPAACDAAMARIDPNNTDAISDVVKKVALMPACLENK